MINNNQTHPRKKCGPHFQKACQKHIWIPINGVQQISQKVLLLQDSQVATADDLEDRAPGSWGWLSWGHYCTQSNCTLTHTHTLADTQTHRETGGRQQSPCHFQLQPAHVLSSDTLHTAQWASAPLVPHCRHREAAKELLQLCRTNTEISLPEKHIILSEMS